MNALQEIKIINLMILQAFLVEDQTSFSVLTAVLNHIKITNGLSVTISKSSVQSFYLGKKKILIMNYGQCRCGFYHYTVKHYQEIHGIVKPYLDPYIQAPFCQGEALKWARL